MKYTLPLTLSAGVFLLCGCAMFQAKQPPPPSEVPRKVLVAPVGKHWQVIEEAPTLTNERNDRLPFQMEQSVQPAGAQPVSPAEKRKIETPR
jgi:hypothetical protein